MRYCGYAKYAVVERCQIGPINRYYYFSNGMLQSDVYIVLPWTQIGNKFCYVVLLVVIKGLVAYVHSTTALQQDIVVGDAT